MTMKVTMCETLQKWTVILWGIALVMDVTLAVFTEYKELNVSHFIGCCGQPVGCQSEDKPNYYRYMEPSISDPDIIYVGAMNFLFVINTSTPALTCTKSQYLPQTNNTKDRCTRQGKSNIPDCQNHIREVFEVGDHLEVCGTGAYSPVMYNLNVTNMSINQTGESALPTCPYDPHDNYTLLYSKSGNPGNSSAMYFGYYMDFIKNFPVFLRPRYKPHDVMYVEKMTDTEDVNWLNAPQFVGSFDRENDVVMFFREKAMESQESTNKVYSRIGKVCKNDLGGGSVDLARKKWLSFQKARLICSLPGAQPYYFDDIYDVAYDGKQYFYALFYKPGADLNASAICVYDKDDIQSAFDGPFMQKNGNMVNPSPNPRLDDCSLHDRTPEIFNGLSSYYQLMYTPVQPVSGKPIFYKHGEQLLRLALGPLKGPHRNIYVGTSSGEIYDIYVDETRWQTYHNAKLFPFANTPQPKRPIWKLMLKDNYLIAGTDYSVTKVQLDICSSICSDKNITVVKNLDECLYNTRCKLCQNMTKCYQADDSQESCVTIENVTGLSVREFILKNKKFEVPLEHPPAFKDLYVPLSIKYPLRLDGVRWKREEKLIEDQERYAFSQNELVLKKIDMQHGGMYIAEDSYGTKVAKFQIDVKEDENMIDVWKQGFIDWSSAFRQWKDCAGNYLDSCPRIP